MEIRDNFNLFNLFLEKKVKIFVDRTSFYVRVPTIKEFSLQETINGIYHVWNLPTDKLKELIPLPCENSLDLTKAILFQLGIYKEYSVISDNIKEGLNFFIPGVEIDYKNKELIIEDITITEQI